MRDIFNKNSVISTEKNELCLFYKAIMNFLFKGGDDDSEFAVKPMDGSILVARPLDREKREIYNITLTATDMVHETHAYVSKNNGYLFC